MFLFRRWKQYWNPFALDLLCCSSSCSPKLLACLAGYQIMTYAPRRHFKCQLMSQPFQNLRKSVAILYFIRNFPSILAPRLPMDSQRDHIGSRLCRLRAGSGRHACAIIAVLCHLNWRCFRCFEMAWDGHTRRTKHHDKNAGTRKVESQQKWISNPMLSHWECVLFHG